MPEIDINELRGKQEQELRFDLLRLEKELFELRFKSSAEDVTAPHRIGEIRRGVARIKTLLRQRELEAEAKSALQTPTGGRATGQENA